MKYELTTLVGGIMSGCVSVTAGCNNYETKHALLVGIIGSVVYFISVVAFEKLKVDDPLQVSQIHGCCGLWGLISVGIFDRTTGVIFTGDFRHLGVQIVGAIAIVSWNSLISVTFFYLLKSQNRLRVGEVVEIFGLDALEDASISKLTKEKSLS